MAGPRCAHTEPGCRQVNHRKDLEKVKQLHHIDSCLRAVDPGLLRVVGAYCRDYGPSTLAQRDEMCLLTLNCDENDTTPWQAGCLAGRFGSDA